MRLVMVMVLAALLALPLRTGAQTAEEAATAEPGVQESAPSSEPAPEEPALQLKVDDAGVEVAPGYPPRTADGYTLEQMEVRVKRARIGLGVSVFATVAGAGMALSALGGLACFAETECPQPGWVAPVGWTGLFVMVGGLVGVGVSAATPYGTRRRVQWDRAQSRVVF
jgi:hypothetical protein